MPTHYQGTPAETLALDTFIKLTRATETVLARLFDQRGDLTPSQFGVLETLHHLGPLTQGELSAKLLRSTGNMTLVLDNLEKRGLVSRERSQTDRRVVHIKITPAGDELITAIFPAFAQAIVEVFHPLSPEEQLQLQALCRKLGLGQEQGSKES